MNAQPHQINFMVNSLLIVTKCTKRKSFLYCIAVDMCRTRIEKLMFKKQPRIVCTLFDLFGTQIKESNPIWDMVLCIAKTNFSKIKVNMHRRIFANNLIHAFSLFGVFQQTFDFDGSDADFIKQFLLDMKLFTEMTAHLSDREKYELIVDPGELSNFVHIADRRVNDNFSI